jgi:hypothetical protein
MKKYLSLPDDFFPPALGKICEKCTQQPTDFQGKLVPAESPGGLRGGERRSPEQAGPAGHGERIRPIMDCKYLLGQHSEFCFKRQRILLFSSRCLIVSSSSVENILICL